MGNQKTLPEPHYQHFLKMEAEIERLRSIIDFVDSWVSNPVGAYSVDALNGLFSMTRDRINAISDESR